MNISTRAKKLTAVLGTVVLLALAGCSSGGGGGAGDRSSGDGAKLKIALSNSVISNKWRVQTVNQFESACASQPWADEVECSVYNSGDDVNRQAQQISNLISEKVDAIIVNPASSTGLNSVIKQACDRGILVIAFDVPVTEPCALLVAPDNREFGKLAAEWVVEQTGGKGNVLMLNGVVGKSNDADRTAAAEEVFAKNPGINLVARVQGDWDNATAQRNTAAIIPTLPEVDVIWGQGGSAGVLKAFIAAGKPLPPTTGESENGFRRFMTPEGSGGHTVKALSLGYVTYLGVLSLELARQILNEGRAAEGFTVPFPVVTNDTLRPGIDVLPDQDDDFYTSYTGTGDNPMVVMCSESAISGAPCSEKPIVNIPPATR